MGSKAVGKCSVNYYNDKDQIFGILFVSGYVMIFSDDGSKAILSVRGGGGKFVVFDQHHFYVNGNLCDTTKVLPQILKVHDTVSVFMEDMKHPVKLSTFSVRYKATMAWVGTNPYSCDYRKAARLRAEETQNEVFEIVSDVPIGDLQQKHGLTYWCTEQLGLIACKSDMNCIENVLVTPQCLYVHGHKLNKENFRFACADKYFSMYCKQIPCQTIFGVAVRLEAVVAWEGRKPRISLSYVQYQSAKDEPVTGTQVFFNEQVKKNLCLSNTDRDNAASNTHTEYIYVCGSFLEAKNNFMLYGSRDSATRFSCDKLYIDGKQYKSTVTAAEFFNNSCKIFLHGFALPLKIPQLWNGINVCSEAVFVWVGKPTAELKRKIRRIVLATGDRVEVFIDMKDIMGRDFAITPARTVTQGKVSGYVLTCSSTDAVVTGYTNTVMITRERFYVQGKKFKGTSLLEYFSKHSEKVHTFIVPMKPTLIRGVEVFSRAVCAWIGDEPSELKTIIYEDKRNTLSLRLDPNHSETGRLYYFVGRVLKMGEKEGIMRCDSDNIHIDVVFSISDLYKHGRKVDIYSVLAVHCDVLFHSRWSLLAHYSSVPFHEGVQYKAVAVWHHENQPDLFDEFQNKVKLWYERCHNSSCKCAQTLKSLLKKEFSSINWGILTERKTTTVTIGVKDKGLISLNRNLVWADECSCYISESDESRPCCTVFAPDGKTPLFCWIGKAPSIDYNLQINTDGSDRMLHADFDSDEDMSEDFFKTSVKKHGNDGGDNREDNESDHGSTNSFNESNLEADEENENDLDLTEVSDPYELLDASSKSNFVVVRNSKQNAKQNKNHGLSEIREFSGRHVTGQIMRILNDRAIASWYWLEYCATVLLAVDLNYLFVDGITFSKGVFSEDEWKSKTFNFYVNSLKGAEYYGLLEVSTRASVGWLGSRPIFVPPPGKQKKGTLLLKKIRVVYSDKNNDMLKFCTMDAWKQKVSTERRIDEKRGPQQGEIGEEKTLKKLLGLSLSAANTAKNKIQERTAPSPTMEKYFTNNVNDRPSPVPSELMDVRSSSLKEQVSQAQSLCSSNNSQGLFGKIDELHADVGKIIGEDGTEHYFKPDQFLLYGHSLADVELYYVLVIGLQVCYCVGPDNRLQVVWHGSLTLPKDQILMNLIVWCDENIVSDDTRAILAIVLVFSTLPRYKIVDGLTTSLDFLLLSKSEFMNIVQTIRKSFIYSL